MIIYIAADHRGFQLKESLKTFIRSLGYAVGDLGNEKYDESDDYPDFAMKVADRVNRDYENARGVVICGSGVGVDVVANKFPRVISALVANPNQAYDSRNDDNSNILALGANYLNEEDAKHIVSVWLQTPFSGDPRHERRIKKVLQIGINQMEGKKEEEDEEEEKQ